MLIIADKKIPEKAKSNLRKYGELVLLETKGITEESISGHPDIFFCRTPGTLVIAPNLPETVKKILSEKNIAFTEGSSPVEVKYPFSASYNAVVTENFFIHHTGITDTIVTDNCIHLSKIHVLQGYTRCNLLRLDEGHFITSDKGIYKTLTEKGLFALYVSPSDIILPGHDYGFFGGACGIFENTFFVIGNLSKYCDGEKVKSFVEKFHYDIIELYDGPLFDGGSVLFL